MRSLMFLQWPPAQDNEKGAAHVHTIAVSGLLTLGEGLAEKAAERRCANFSSPNEKCVFLASAFGIN